MRRNEDRRRLQPGLLRSIVLALLAFLLAASAQVPFACPASPALHGEWTAECRLRALPENKPRMDLEQEHIVSFAFESPHFEVALALTADSEGLADGDVEALWERDPFELLAEVRFDVRAADWDKTRFGFEFDPETVPLELEATWDLYRSRSRLRLQAEADLEPLAMDLDLRFDTSDQHGFRFDRADVTIECPLADKTEISWETRFSEGGGWEFADVEFDLPECFLPAWLDVECLVRIDSEETSIELDADLSLPDLVLHRNPASSPEPFPPLVVELPLEARLDHRGHFGGVSVMGIALACELEGRCIEAAASFDPEWNKKLTGDKRFDRGLRVQWEEEFVTVPNTLSRDGEVYIAVAPNLRDDPEGEIGFLARISETTPTETERRLSCRFKAPFPARSESDEASWEMEIGLFWGW